MLVCVNYEWGKTTEEKRIPFMLEDYITLSASDYIILNTIEKV